MTTTVTVTDTETITEAVSDSCNIISGGFHGYPLYEKMLYSPTVLEQTLNAITSLTPTQILSRNQLNSSNMPFFAMTDESVFVGPHSATTIRKISIDNPATYQDYTTSDGIFFCLYDEYTVFNIEYNSNTYYVKKITFPFGGGDGTSETAYSFSDSDTYNSETYISPTNVYFQHLKYGNYDSLIHISYWVASDSETLPQYVIRCIIYDINAETTSDQWIEFTDGAWLEGFDPDCSSCYWNNITPSFYNSKMIFTFRIDDYIHPHPSMPPYPNVCKIPTFIVDISDNTITRVDNLKQQGWQGGWNTASSIDYDNRIYYFTSYFESSVGAEDDEYIYSVNLDTETMAMGDVCSPYFELHQDISSAIGLEDPSGAGNFDILSIPAQSVIANIDMLSSLGYEASFVLDIPEEMAWSITDTGLQGKSISGGSDRNITIVWAGDGTIPWTYPSQNEAWFRILDGKAVIMLYSRTASPTYYHQYDIYLLTETP